MKRLIQAPRTASPVMESPWILGGLRSDCLAFILPGLAALILALTIGRQSLEAGAFLVICASVLDASHIGYCLAHLAPQTGVEAGSDFLLSSAPSDIFVLLGHPALVSCSPFFIHDLCGCVSPDASELRRLSLVRIS